MISSLKLSIAFPLLACTLLGEPGTYTYTGDIVNARCMQAEAIVNRNSRGYVPAGVAAFTGSRYQSLNTPRMRKEILQHCTVNPGSTEFALVDDQGNFFKLDEKGNSEIISQTTSAAKKIRVTIRGHVDRDTLIVHSLSTI